MQITTARLRLRKPTTADLQSIFEQYASDPVVTRYLSWPTHKTIADTEAFLEFSDAQWNSNAVGPFLIETLNNGQLVGSTGLELDTPYRASTGYLFSQAVWGQGYASEALAAMIDLAGQLDVHRIEAITHVDHHASGHVLIKGGFHQEGVLREHTVFPNFGDLAPQDICMFGRTIDRV